LLLSAALVLLWVPGTELPKPATADSPPAPKSVSSAPKDNTAPRNLPDAPVAKSESSSVEPATPAVQPFSNAPLKSALDRPAPTPRQRRLWYTFLVAGHGAAAFDAWSTRNAISQNYGTESDPFLRPFSHSNALYAATQVSPAVMDFLGRRMMTSGHPMLRRMWWVPQVAGATFSFSAGMHNYNLTH
jgi:hypothetical protein